MNTYQVTTPNGPGIAEGCDEHGNILVRHVIKDMIPTGAGANLTPNARIKCLFAYQPHQVTEAK